MRRIRPIKSSKEKNYLVLRHFKFVSFSVPKLLSEGVVEKMFPLHNHDDLAKLKKTWVSAFFKKQPLGESL